MLMPPCHAADQIILMLLLMMFFDIDFLLPFSRLFIADY